MNRDSVIFYRSFYEAIKELPEEIQGQVYSAIFEYSLNFTERELTGIAKTIFTLIKPQLDANNKRFKNGKKGGRPNQDETETKPNNNQDVTKQEANNNENVNENNKVNYNEKVLELDAQKITSNSFTNIETFLLYVEKQSVFERIVRAIGTKPEYTRYVKIYVKYKLNQWDLEGILETKTVGKLLSWLPKDWKKWENESGVIRKLVM